MQKYKFITAIIIVKLLLITHQINAQSVPKMILVEGGEMQMGSDYGEENEKPIHKVQLNSFYIAEHETTVAQYREFAKATGKEMPPAPSQEWMKTHVHTMKYYTSPAQTWWGWQDQLPMHHVNWYEAIEYCNWLSEKNGLEKCYTEDPDKGWIIDLTKNGYRLPTEAEWEYAARGGNKSQNFKYSGSNDPTEVAWYDDTSGQKSPQEVKQKKPNELGIYDMSGNVWEWCNDYYAADYYKKSPTKNPFNDKFSAYRVLRGGSWHYRVEYATVADRDGPEPKFTNYNYGFRIAKTN